MAPRDNAEAVKKGIDLTLRTIDQRVRLYRCLMVAIIGLLVGSVSAGFVLRSWWAIGGFIITAPATGAYLALDALVVRRWAADIEGLLNDRGMNLQLFSKVMLAHPLFPKATIQGLLSRIDIAIERDDPEA